MTFKDFIGDGSTGIVGLLGTLVVPIIFTLALFVFVWGVIKYFLLHGDDEKARATGREFILWGIIGMVVLFSVWELVRLLLSTFGF